MKIEQGHIIIFPTDTVYGIGCGVLDDEAQQRISIIKGREETKRLAVLCANIAQVDDLAYISYEASLLMQAFWPGALTIILKSKREVENLAIQKTVGVRVPNHEVALEILRENGPMATTSVNFSGEDPLLDIALIKATFGLLVDAIIEGEPPTIECSSTVIDMTEKTPKILRLGSISEAAIHKVLNG